MSSGYPSLIFLTTIMKKIHSFFFAAFLMLLLMSQTVFAQTQSWLDVLPNGGERLRAGKTCSLRWNGRIPDTTSTVALKLWNGETGKWATLASGIKVTDGKYA